MAGQAQDRNNQRGGARPGAGAPLGNLNALKHGGHSHKLRAFAAAIAEAILADDFLIDTALNLAQQGIIPREFVEAMFRWGALKGLGRQTDPGRVAKRRR